MLAVFHEDLSIHDRRVVPSAALDISTSASWKVVDVFRAGEGKFLKIDDIYIGVGTFSYSTSVHQTEEVRCI